jgi:hypothetical protein
MNLSDNDQEETMDSSAERVRKKKVMRKGMVKTVANAKVAKEMFDESADEWNEEEGTDVVPAKETTKKTPAKVVSKGKRNGDAIVCGVEAAIDTEDVEAINVNADRNDKKKSQAKKLSKTATTKASFSASKQGPKPMLAAVPKKTGVKTALGKRKEAQKEDKSIPSKKSSKEKTGKLKTQGNPVEKQKQKPLVEAKAQQVERSDESSSEDQEEEDAEEDVLDADELKGEDLDGGSAKGRAFMGSMAFSGGDEETASLVLSACKSLNGYTEAPVSDASIFIVGHTGRRTESILLAISRSIPVVNVDFVTASISAGRWLRWQDYERHAGARAARLRRESSNDAGFLKRMRVKICGEPPICLRTLHAIVKNCGGRIVQSRADVTLVGSNADYECLPHANVVRFKWLADSIEAQAVLGFELYMPGGTSQTAVVE